MKNPYDDIVEPEEIRVSRSWARVLIFLFLAVCVIPPLWRNVIGNQTAADGRRWVPVMEFWQDQAPGEPGLNAHLKAFEADLEKAPFAEAARRTIQAALTRSLGEGNTKTRVGDDGWLFFKPAIEAITAGGPMRSREIGAASDPALKRWQPPLPVIIRYGEQLRERGIELLLVPVPVKPMIYPEKLTNALFDGPITHPDMASFYDALRKSGIEILDLAPLLWDLKAEGDVFLKQDTHWRPSAMKRAAAAVAEKVRGMPWYAPIHKYEFAAVERAHIGDLVEKLDLPAGSTLFEEERATVERVIDPATGDRPPTDRTSPIVLLGDSFVNIFDDSAIGFGTGVTDEFVGAGFAQHLAAELGMSLDVIAVNGGASTQVRKMFAERPDDEVRAKKYVIWVIASRDLLYSAKEAMANEVVWEEVEWNDRISGGDSPQVTGELAVPDEGILVEATLSEAASIPDPNTLNYTSGTYESRWIDLAAVDGSGTLDEAFLRLWAFRDKKPVPTATADAGGGLAVGGRYRFVVVPLFTNEAAESAQVQELEKDGFPEMFFAESVDPAP